MADVRPNQHVEWDAVEGAAAYDAEAQTLGGVVINTIEVAGTSVLVADLMAGQSLGVVFKVHVRAKDVFGPGAWSAFTGSLTLVGLDAPLNIRVV